MRALNLFYGLGARWPGIQTHSVPLHFQKPMTHVMVDHEGRTGDISGLGGGRGGASGGTVSHAASDTTTASDTIDSFPFHIAIICAVTG